MCRGGSTASGFGSGHLQAAFGLGDRASGPTLGQTSCEGEIGIELNQVRRDEATIVGTQFYIDLYDPCVSLYFGIFHGRILSVSTHVQSVHARRHRQIRAGARRLARCQADLSMSSVGRVRPRPGLGRAKFILPWRWRSILVSLSIVFFHPQCDRFVTVAVLHGGSIEICDRECETGCSRDRRFDCH